MVYLLLGEDNVAKDQKIEDIKSKLIKSHEAVQFDYEILHGYKLNPADLKRALISLPALSVKRLILIREIQKLVEQNKKIILEFIESKAEHADVILETSEEETPGFILKILNKVKVFQSPKTAQHNAFDMTNAMSGGDSLKALQILSNLYAAGQHPLQVMGALVWFWGKFKGRLPAENFKKGLFELQQADLNIKRSRLEAEYALEVLVVKLTNLVAC